jgi:phosphomannomutase
LWDQLEDIHREVGLSITMQRTIKLQPGTSGDAIMKRLRAEQRRQVGAFTIALADDLNRRPPKSLAGFDEIPKNDVLRYYIASKESQRMTRDEIMLSQPRIIVRPSGTEPKVSLSCVTQVVKQADCLF